MLVDSLWYELDAMGENTTPSCCCFTIEVESSCVGDLGTTEKGVWFNQYNIEDPL